MIDRKPRTVSYRRKREQKTDYHKRLKLLVSKELRLVVRLTNQKIIGQLVRFLPAGDEVVLGTDSFALRALGWTYSCKNFPAAYLTGLLLGKRALEKGEKKAILDTGFRQTFPKGRVYAFLKGVIDAGLEVPYGEEEKIFPTMERISGKHVEEYAQKLKGENEKEYKEHFSQYLKSNAPEKIAAVFEQVKSKILKK